MTKKEAKHGTLAGRCAWPENTEGLVAHSGNISIRTDSQCVNGLSGSKWRAFFV
jgi:hypothetical protein